VADGCQITERWLKAAPHTMLSMQNPSTAGGDMRGCTDYTEEARGWIKPSHKRTNSKRLFVYVLVAVLVVLLVSAFWPKQTEGGFVIAGPKDLATGNDSQITETKPSGEPSALANTIEKNQTLIVYVTGAVVSPGVYELKAGDRIHDAIVLAGGLTDKAAVNYINLAAPLQDGSHIHIPLISEIESGEAARIVASGALDTTEYVTPTNTENPQKSQRVNLNTATAAELETLPGVGAVTSKRIIDYRDKYGGFKSIEELKNVSGIGDKKFEDLADKVCI
jgi:competence protein ComEA